MQYNFLSYDKSWINNNNNKRVINDLNWQKFASKLFSNIYNYFYRKIKKIVRQTTKKILNLSFLLSIEPIIPHFQAQLRTWKQACFILRHFLKQD